jgi:hypothetical protein
MSYNKVFSPVPSYLLFIFIGKIMKARVSPPIYINGYKKVIPNKDLQTKSPGKFSQWVALLIGNIRN